MTIVLVPVAVPLAGLAVVWLLCVRRARRRRRGRAASWVAFVRGHRDLDRDLDHIWYHR